MRIVICYPQIPFMKGGAEKHVDYLFQELKKRKHEVEIIKIPFMWYPPLKILDSVVLWKLLDLTEANGKKIDLVISTKFPSYVVEHPNHVTWLFHQHREAYDLQNTEFDELKKSSEGEFVRKKIKEIDNKCLKKVKKIFTNSQNVSNRLKKFNQIDSEPLYLPIPDAKKFYNKEYGDYVLYPSRISPLKRQDLLVEAMKYTKTKVKCKIIGFADHKNWLDSKLIESKQRENVELLTDVSDEELVDLYSKSLAVVFIPIDEDMGIITLEAFHSEKPVLTATDSGGPLEFVKDGFNGFIVNPDPKEIARKLDELYSNTEQTKKMGKAGLETITKLNLNWDNVIEKLTSQ